MSDAAVRRLIKLGVVEQRPTWHGTTGFSSGPSGAAQTAAASPSQRRAAAQLRNGAILNLGAVVPGASRDHAAVGTRAFRHQRLKRPADSDGKIPSTTLAILCVQCPDAGLSLVRIFWREATGPSSFTLSTDHRANAFDIGFVRGNPRVAEAGDDRRTG